jgi:hypothetical protein
MEHSSVMDLTLHDSGAQLEEDLAMIRGRTQVNGIVRRQANIIVNNSDDDEEEEEGDEDDGEEEDDVESFELVKGMGSKTKTSDEGFEKVVKFDDTKNFEFGVPIEQIDEASLECDMDTQSHLEGKTKKVNNNNNNVLHNSESDDITENVLTKKRILKRKKNESYSVLNVEGSKHSKKLLVHKRKSQNSVVTDGEERGDLEESHDGNSESENVNSRENLKLKKRKKRHDSVDVKCRSDEGLVQNMYGEDDGVDSICEGDAGDTVEEEMGEGEFWEDMYGRTRDRQGNVIQVRIYSWQTVNTGADCSMNRLLCLLPLEQNTEMLPSL